MLAPYLWLPFCQNCIQAGSYAKLIQPSIKLQEPRPKTISRVSERIMNRWDGHTKRRLFRKIVRRNEDPKLKTTEDVMNWKYIVKKMIVDSQLSPSVHHALPWDNLPKEMTASLLVLIQPSFFFIVSQNSHDSHLPVGLESMSSNRFSTHTKGAIDFINNYSFLEENLLGRPINVVTLGRHEWECTHYEQKVDDPHSQNRCYILRT